MELRLHFFNVQHGDSAVIEVQKDDSSVYIVIDSSTIRKNGRTISPAFDFLTSKGVKSLEALMITHLHRDHFRGVEVFLNNFDIGKLLIPPLFSQKSGKFKAILAQYRSKVKDVLKRTEDRTVIQEMNSLTELLSYIYQHEAKIEEQCGRENLLRFPSLPDLDCRVLVPLPKLKGIIHQKIMDGKFDIDPFPEMNDFSIGFWIEFAGFRCLFTGDSGDAVWTEHKRQMKAGGCLNLRSHFVKSPHHGSTDGNSEEFYDYVSDPARDLRHAFISANGISHPSLSALRSMVRKNFTPHCTNFSKYCLPNGSSEHKDFSPVPNEFHRFLRYYANQPDPIACQGDMTLVLKDNGVYETKSSTGMLCIYSAPRQGAE